MQKYATFTDFYPFYFFEHNRPATFTYPFYSFLGDWVMRCEILRGRIKF